MKKEKRVQGKSSAAADRNQTENLAGNFNQSAGIALGSFDNLFDCVMADDLRGCVYLLRQDVVNLINSGQALLSAAPGSSSGAGLAASAPPAEAAADRNQTTTLVADLDYWGRDAMSDINDMIEEEESVGPRCRLAVLREKLAELTAIGRALSEPINTRSDGAR